MECGSVPRRPEDREYRLRNPKGRRQEASRANPGDIAFIAATVADSDEQMSDGSGNED